MTSEVGWIVFIGLERLLDNMFSCSSYWRYKRFPNADIMSMIVKHVRRDVRGLSGERKISTRSTSAIDVM